MSNLENIASITTQREQSLFPFCDTSPLTTVSGIPFPHDVFKDARVLLCGDTQKLFLRSIRVTNNQANILFLDRTEQTQLRILADLNAAADAMVSVVDRYGLPTGFVVLNTGKLLEWVTTHNTSAYLFPPEVNFLLPTCLHFYPLDGVRFKLPTGEIIGGPVVLIGENGAVLQYGRVLEPASTYFQPENGFDVLRVDFVGDALPKDETCDRVDETTPRVFLEDFGGATRDDAGNIQITAQRFENGTALKVDTDPLNKTIRLYLAGAT